MVKRRFQSSVMNIAKTKSFPGANIGSDNELVMMTSQAPPPKGEKPGQHKDQVQSGKLKDPKIADFFRATIGGKFAPLLALENQYTEIDALINSFKHCLDRNSQQHPWQTPTSKEALGH